MTTRTQALLTCLFGIRRYTWNRWKSPCMPDAVSSDCSGDDEDEEKVPMKTDDGDGHKMRQAAKKKSGSN